MPNDRQGNQLLLEEGDELLTPEEVAAILKVSVRRVYALRESKTLVGIRLGRTLRFRRSQLESALAAGTDQEWP